MTDALDPQKLYNAAHNVESQRRVPARGGDQMSTTVILISGRGSNLLALLEAQLPGRIAAVISNRAEAGGLVYARERGVATVVLDHRGYASREAYDAALAEEIDRHRPDLVVLAGFMRILGDPFVRRFSGRLLNIHPSLLPAFPGLHAQRQALEYGVRVSGCTVHFVDEGLDSGPIILQEAVPVLPEDTEEALSARILEVEHRIYPRAVSLLAAEKLECAGRAVRIRD